MWYLIYFFTHRATYRVLFGVRVLLIILVCAFVILQKDRMALLCQQPRKKIIKQHHLMPKPPLSLRAAAQHAGVSLQPVGTQYCLTGSMARLGFFVWLMTTYGSGLAYMSYTATATLCQLKVKP